MNNRVGVPTELTYYRDPGNFVYVDDSDGNGLAALFTPVPAAADDVGAIGNGTGDFIIWTDLNDIIDFPS